MGGSLVAEWGPLVALAPVWVLAMFAPGMVVVRRLRWGALERLCAAAGASMFVVYLAAFGIYVLGLGRWANWVVLGVFAVAAGACWREWLGLWRVRGVRRAAGVLGLMLLWGTLCQGVTRHYSGAGWARDWVLHYQKVKAFTRGITDDPVVVREMILDRPGLANLVAAFFTGALGLRFDVFQLAFTWQNLLAVLPCCWLMGRFGRRGGRGVWVLAAMLICLPMVWVNATYTWTKMPAAFFVMLGIGLYLRAIDKGDRVRMVAAAGSLGAGVLAHYVALPYAALVLGHYLVFVWRSRERRWGEIAWVVAGFGVVLGTWFGWTAGRYGIEEMRGANATLQYAARETWGEFWMKAARTFVWNIVPPQVRPVRAVWAQQTDVLGQVRDWFYVLYQMNLLFITGTVTGVLAAVGVCRRLRFAGGWDGWTWVCAAVGAGVVVLLRFLPGTNWVMADLFAGPVAMGMGIVGGAWVGGIVARAVRGWRGASAEVWFWRMLVVGLPVVSAPTLDWTGALGAGHVYYHAWVMMAVGLVAVSVGGMRGWVKGVLGVGMAVDFVLGVFLHFYVQGMTFSFSPEGRLETHGHAVQAAINWGAKVQAGWVFLGDRCAGGAGVLQVVLLAGGLLAAVAVGMGWIGRGSRNLDRGGGEDKIGG